MEENLEGVQEVVGEGLLELLKDPSSTVETRWCPWNTT